MTLIITIKKIMQAYKFLFRALGHVANNVPLIVSSILPRLIDYDSSRGVCMQINTRLEEFCRKNNLKFVRSYNGFLHAGRPISGLYAVWDGGYI